MTQHARRKLNLPKLALVCSITLAMLLTGCVMVRVSDPIDNEISWDIESAISVCLSEVTGKSIDALERIDYDVHVKLEDCVNKKVKSKERIVIIYRGSKKGLIPQAM